MEEKNPSEKNVRLFTYKMTHDSGFAPNPFFNRLTLATCKPGIRKTKKVGDWLAGLSSISLSAKAKQCGVELDPNALIYLARISEVLTLDEYYRDERFKEKIPPTSQNTDQKQCAGDNIYRLAANGNYQQVSQIHHDEADRDHDVSGRNALICDEYYYLGRKGVNIPDTIALNRPHGPTAYGYKNTEIAEVEALIFWVRKNFKAGWNALPCLWDGWDENQCGTCGSGNIKCGARKVKSKCC